MNLSSAARRMNLFSVARRMNLFSAALRMNLFSVARRMNLFSAALRMKYSMSLDFIFLLRKNNFIQIVTFSDDVVADAGIKICVVRHVYVLSCQRFCKNLFL